MERETGNEYTIVVGKPYRKKPLGRTRRRWDDNIKTNLGKWDWRVWIGLIWLGIGTGGALLKTQ
jgi:hypothetical protein